MIRWIILFLLLAVTACQPHKKASAVVATQERQATADPIPAAPAPAAMILLPDGTKVLLPPPTAEHTQNDSIRPGAVATTKARSKTGLGRAVSKVFGRKNPAPSKTGKQKTKNSGNVTYNIRVDVKDKSSSKEKTVKKKKEITKVKPKTKDQSKVKIRKKQTAPAGAPKLGFFAEVKRTAMHVLLIIVLAAVATLVGWWKLRKMFL